MRNALLAVALLAALLACGCGDLLSLHPLYTGQDRVLDQALEGRWEDDDNLLTVTRDGIAYDVTLKPKSSPSTPQQFEMRLLDLGGVRMADIIPTDGMLGHMFLKYLLNNPGRDPKRRQAELPELLKRSTPATGTHHL
jgi:hypothetical protein